MCAVPNVCADKKPALILNKAASILTSYGDFIFIFALFIYIVTFSWFSIERLNSFQMTGTDLAIFTHSIWTTLNEGKILFNTIEFLSHGGVTSHFGVHVSPILFLLIPGFVIYQGPESLLVTQSILLGIGAIPVYLIGKKLIGNPGGLVIASSYLLYPPLHSVNFSNFHEVAFLPFLLGFFLYGCIVRNNCIAFLSGILCLCVKEDVSLIIIAACLVMLWKNRDKTRTEYITLLSLLIISIIWLILAFTTIMPAFTPENEIISTTFLNQYYTTPSTPFSNIYPKFQYLLLILVPVLFLPLISPEILAIALPSFGEILLSPQYFNIEYQYSALFIAPLYFATVLTLRTIKTHDKTKKYFAGTLISLFIIGIIATILVSPLFQTMIKEENQDLRADSDWFKNGISLIPPDASVSTQANLVSFFAERPKIYHEYVQNSDYVVIWEKVTDSTVLIDHITEIAKKYQCIYKKEGLFIFKLNTPMNSGSNTRVV